MVAKIASVFLILMGIIWLGQGLGFIAGSFMTGQSFWALMGFACLVAGGFLAYLGYFRPRQG
jgi:hypothetical protein